MLCEFRRGHYLVALIANHDPPQSRPCLDMKTLRQPRLGAPKAILDPCQHAGLAAMRTDQGTGGHTMRTQLTHF